MAGLDEGESMATPCHTPMAGVKLFHAKQIEINENCEMKFSGVTREFESRES
jgi:hypothetical protein